jgi:lipoprotein-anchoring transpeptidase ErfK/SrfK
MPAFRPPINKLIVINREQRKLKLYKRPPWSAKFKRHRVYKIAIGAKGYETPAGLYVINSRAKCPEWLIPDSKWATDAGLTPGTIVPGCTPENPLKERWLGFTDEHDIGIHGTAAIQSLGTAASHGCIRMDPQEVIKLYGMVPKGTPIYVI